VLPRMCACSCRLPAMRQNTSLSLRKPRTHPMKHALVPILPFTLVGRLYTLGR